MLARTKTDATDARRIARFCEAHAVAPWTPASPAQQHLRALLTARETLVQERLRLSNRQQAAGYTASQALVTELQAPVLAAIEGQIAHIDRELAKLAAADTPLGAQLRVVVTIPGLGLTTAGALLASLPLDRLETSRQVAAYVGLCPQERSSGSSVRGRSHVGPLGPASLRKALYLPAIVAMRCNPLLHAFAERLRAKGKRPKVVITAVMRKLLLLAWTLLRTGQPFSATHHIQHAPQGSAATAGKRCYSTWHSWGIRMPTLRFCSISPTSSPVVVVGGQAGGRQVPFAATSPEHVCAGPTPTTWGGLGNTCGTRGSRLAAEVGRGGVVGQDDQPARSARHGSAEGLFGPQRISSVGARAARWEQPSSWHRRRRASSDARRKPLRSPAC